MYTVKATTIGHAHAMALSTILQNGHLKITEDNEFTIELPEPLSIHITSPRLPPHALSTTEYKEHFINLYKPTLHTITYRKHDNTDPSYTYGNRLTDYPIPYTKYLTNNIMYSGDGNINRGLNQIKDSIIDRLNSNPGSRRAIAITWWPLHDIDNPEPPCLQLIQAQIHQNKLNILATFRSNDMLSAWGMNALTLSDLQDHIINSLTFNVSPGYIETTSNNAHIYHIRDLTALNKYIDSSSDKMVLREALNNIING